jgi:multidrug transporter EmrE-like cation transporter
MISPIDFSLLITAILFGVLGQILLKQGVSKAPQLRIKDLFSLIGNTQIVGGFLCYGISTLFYIRSLAGLDLALAYPTVSLGYVFVVLLSRIILKELVTPQRWMAVLLICIGVALVGLGGN